MVVSCGIAADVVAAWHGQAEQDDPGGIRRWTDDHCYWRHRRHRGSTGAGSAGCAVPLASGLAAGADHLADLGP